MPVVIGAFRGSVPKLLCAPEIVLCPEKFFLNIYHNKNKNLPPQQFILPSKPQNLATGLLYTSLHFQICGILTALESENVSDFRPHTIFAVS